MRSKMLIDMAQSKNGWKPVAISNPETGVKQNDRCMISNGRVSKLVVVNGDDKDIDSLLEKRVMKEIRDLVAEDESIMLRETLVFSAIAQASVSQAQIFAPLVQREAKASLNNYVSHAEKIVKAIQKDAINVHGEQMELMLNNLEAAASTVYDKFGNSLIDGNLPEFMDYVLNFGVTTEKPKSKSKTKK